MAEKRPCSDAPAEVGGRPPSPTPPPVAEGCPPADPGPDATPAAKESASEAVEAPNSTAGEHPAAVGADGRSFSQLLAGAMSSPVGSPHATPIIAVPVDAVRLPVVAVPCFLAPAGLLESPGFSGQFAMTHQAVLATVTAQAQMQLQAAYPSSSSELVSTSVSQPMSSTNSPVPLQQRPSTVPDRVCTPETEQLPSVQKPQSAHIVVKTTTSDGYNWRKYGQKQVKSSESSRSYYKCTNTNCFAKKKVERCPDGQIVEIIYRGEHNHDPPQKPRCSKERAQSGGTTGEHESLELPSSELNESEPSTCKPEQISGNENPARQLYCSSDCEGDAGMKNEEDISEETDPKRRLIESTMNFSRPVLRTVREPKIVVQTACDAGHGSDGYRWRKYGQKIVKGNPNPSYYRCTHNGCPVRKHVERASDDAKAIVITYEGTHNHDRLAPKNSSDSPAASLITAATADTGEQLNTSDMLSDQKPSKEKQADVGSNLEGERAVELGGEKALESAQTLLSIGLNSASGEANRTNSEGVKRPLFSENPATVPVQNS
uniref:Probable WRKY transcription factor 4 isoform X2 n=1 Tax=Elaeis guineensis var. tenera TaxID=51953 RepID=A0A6I9QGN6_ELAGV|nr:probable WRKY transcription factor 4 isoform X2 [Elaeis guineensis]